MIVALIDHSACRFSNFPPPPGKRRAPAGEAPGSFVPWIDDPILPPDQDPDIRSDIDEPFDEPMPPPIDLPANQPVMPPPL